MITLHVVIDDHGSLTPQVAACRESVRVAAAEAPTLDVRLGSIRDPWPTDGWVLIVEAADRVVRPGLAALAPWLAEPGQRVVYGDHRRPGRVLAERSFHPVWSYEYLLSAGYLECAVAVRADLLGNVIAAAHGRHEGVAGGLLLDLVLRCAEEGVAPQRCPDVVIERHAALPDQSTRADVVAAHLVRTGVSADVGRTDHGTLHVRRADPLAADGTAVTVSVVVPTRGSTGVAWGRTLTWVVGAVRSLAEGGSWPDLEFVIVADEATPAWVRPSLERLVGDSLTWLEWTAPFNFSAKVNLGVKEASGDVVLILNDDTRLISPDAIGEMAARLGSVDPATGSRVAAVGARLLFEDGTLQHAGHVYQEHPLHACVGWPGDEAGPGRRLWAARECTGVTAAAVMVERAAFDEVGGFPLEFPLDFNDVAFCLALRAAGHRIVWTPHASWHHFEGRTRERGPRPDEYAALHSRWGDALDVDPYYHPGLEPRRADWLERHTSRWWNVRGARF